MRKYLWNVSVPDLLKGGIVTGANPKKRGHVLKKLRCHMMSFLAVSMGIFLFNGCGEVPEPKAYDFIIKAGAIRMSPVEFSDELDLKLIAYPYDLKNRPEEYNRMVLDLVSTLSDETILMAAAYEKGISLTPEEVGLAEAEFKKDYPDDSFDQMLLENAIAYAVWKKQLKKDMVINKLVRQDLIDTQEITPEDMIAFYNRYQQKIGRSSDTAEGLDETTLVEQLRMEKSQTSYADWINGLKVQFPVEINKNAVAGFFMNQE